MNDFERFYAKCCTIEHQAAFGGFDFLHIFNKSKPFHLANVTKFMKYDVRILTLPAFCGMMGMKKRLYKK